MGQRLLMLLHAPSAAGMSSPIGGLDGAIPIRQSGAAMPTGDVASPLQPPYVDLRWLGAKLPHAVSYRSEPAPAAKPADAQTPFFGQVATDVTASASIGSFATTKPVLDNASGSEGSVPAQQASVDAVMGMLRSWQSSGQRSGQSSWEKAQHVAP